MARGGGLDDVSQIKKYEISEEDYNKRDNTLRSYAKKQREIDPNFKFFPKEKKDVETFDAESIVGANVGDRCECAPGGRRGTVMYLGLVEGLGGKAMEGSYWVGVKYDDPVGMGDGKGPDGKVYFETMGPKYGGFVIPPNVAIGNYPEEDLLADSDDDLDEL
jgi:tubulin-folding cofactor B